MLKKLFNPLRLYLEDDIYEAIPLVEETIYWVHLADIPDERKARTLKINSLNEDTFYLVYVRKNGKTYARLYIVSANGKKIDILYVKSEAFNPINKM